MTSAELQDVATLLRALNAARFDDVSIRSRRRKVVLYVGGDHVGALKRAEDGSWIVIP